MLVVAFVAFAFGFFLRWRDGGVHRALWNVFNIREVFDAEVSNHHHVVVYVVYDVASRMSSSNRSPDHEKTTNYRRNTTPRGDVR